MPAPSPARCSQPGRNLFGFVNDVTAPLAVPSVHPEIPGTAYLSRRRIAVDLFCGVGGLTRGLLDAGIQVVAGYDIAQECRYPYEYNNRPAAFQKKSVSDVTVEELSSLYPRTAGVSWSDAHLANLSLGILRVLMPLPIRSGACSVISLDSRRV